MTDATSPPATSATGHSAQRPLPPGDAAHRADATREKLLQAAHELLHERLDSGATLNDICARAGANVAMVKYCFGNKDGLFDALLERVMSHVGAEVARLGDLDLAPEEKLRRHVAGLVRNYVRYPYINRFMAERLSTASGSAVGQMSRQFALTAHGFYSVLLAEGQRTSGWRETDPKLFFFTVIGACEFVFSARAWLEHAFETELDDAFLERFTAHAMDVVLLGLTEPSDRH